MTTVVCSCIDFRFQEFVQLFVERNNLVGQHDRIAIAGCTQNIDTFDRQISISMSLHRPQKVILLHHEDCGAYGGSKNFPSFNNELEVNRLSMNQAKHQIEKNYPGVMVEGYFIRLSGEIEKVGI